MELLLMLCAYSLGRSSRNASQPVEPTPAKEIEDPEMATFIAAFKARHKWYFKPSSKAEWAMYIGFHLVYIAIAVVLTRNVPIRP